MPNDDIFHSIVNGSPEFQAQFKDLMHGFSGGDPMAAVHNAPGGLHETLHAILGHLQNQSAPQPKTVQVVRDAGGRMIGAKVIP